MVKYPPFADLLDFVKIYVHTRTLPECSYGTSAVGGAYYLLMLGARYLK